MSALRLVQDAQLDPVEAYRRWLLGQGLSARTVLLRLRFAAMLLAEWGTFDQPPHVLAEWLSRHEGWTRRTYLNHLRSLYGWLVESGQLEADPVARLRRGPMPRPKPHPLPTDQAARLLATATGNLEAFLVLGLYAGFRLHEIAKVRGEDVDETTTYVLGKGGLAATLPTHPEVWRIAQRYPREGHWFPSPAEHREHITHSAVSQQVTAHMRAHGIENGGAHRLRHTYITRLARKGVQPRIIQDLARHSSLDTTMRYIEVSSAERAAAIRSL